MESITAGPSVPFFFLFDFFFFLPVPTSAAIRANSAVSHASAASVFSSSYEAIYVRY
jgi:hypothetical protein